MLGKVYYIINRSYRKVFVVQIIGESRSYEHGDAWETRLLLPDPTDEEQSVFERYYKRIKKDVLEEDRRNYHTCPKEARKVCKEHIQNVLAEAYTERDRCIRSSRRVNSLDLPALGAAAEQEWKDGQPEREKAAKQAEVEREERELERRAARQRNYQTLPDGSPRLSEEGRRMVNVTNSNGTQWSYPAHHVSEATVQEYRTVGGQRVFIEIHDAVNDAPF